MSEQLIVSLDASELDDWQLCEFKWYAGHILHLRHKDPNWNMESGSLLHAILEFYYKLKRDSMLNTDELIELSVEHGRNAALEFETQLPHEVTDTIFNFREYVRVYENESWIPLYVEQPFAYILYEDSELKIIMTGKPDLVFKYIGTTHIGVCDHKKSSRDFDYSPLRNQFMNYCTAMKTDTMVVNKVGFQKSLKAEDRMRRQTFTYRAEILEEWKEDTILSVKKLVIMNEAQIFQRNRTSCEKWNGCFLSKYCLTRPEARPFLIGTEYSVGETWDVTKSLEEGKKDEKSNS